MSDAKPLPVWLESVLVTLREKRDTLHAQVEELSKRAEAARRACVCPQQELSKITDAIRNLEDAAEWFKGGGWEVPL